jgi:hypothetical protein
MILVQAVLRGGRWLMLSLDHRDDCVCDQFRRNYCIDGDMRQSSGRHPSIKRLRRILHDRCTTTGLDRGQSNCSITTGAGEDHGDHAATAGVRSGTKQDVDRWAVAIFARTD